MMWHLTRWLEGDGARHLDLCCSWVAGGPGQTWVCRLEAEDLDAGGRKTVKVVCAPNPLMALERVNEWLAERGER